MTNMCCVCGYLLTNLFIKIILNLTGKMENYGCRLLEV